MNRLLIALGFVSIFSAHGFAGTTNRAIATVNGEPILMSEYEKNWAAYLEQAKTNIPADKIDDAWTQKARERLLDQMVADRVLLMEAKKRKVRVPQRQFENGLVQVKARFLPEAGQKELVAALRRQSAALGPDADESSVDFPAAWKEVTKSNPAAVKEAEAIFAQELKKEGMDAKKFEERIRDQLSVMELSKEAVRARTKIPSDDDSKKLFEKVQLKMDNKPVPGLSSEDEKDVESMAKFFAQQTGERVKARHILISVPGDNGGPTGWKTATEAQKAAARKKILGLKKQLQKGGDFAALAKENSADTGSATNGGDLGSFTKGQMVPAFEKAAFSLAVGQISDVVESPFGLHLIQVDEKRAATKLKWDDVNDDLKEYLMRAGQQKTLEDFVAELRKKAQVKINS